MQVLIKTSTAYIMPSKSYVQNYDNKYDNTNENEDVLLYSS